MIESAVELIKAASASQLALAAFLSLAVAFLCFRFFRTAPIWARLLAFFGVLIFAFALAIRLIAPPDQPPASEPDSKNEQSGSPESTRPPASGPTDLDILVILRAIQPPERRASACSKLADPQRCEKILAAIVDLEPVAVPQVAQAQLQTGQISENTERVVASAVARQPDQVVAIGRGDEWRVDIFWCAAGVNAAANRDAAQSAAQRLIAAGSEQFGATTIGTVRVRELAPGRAGYPQPGSGLWASVDNMQGKARAVEAITVYLGGAAGPYRLRRTGSGLERYISLFQCR